MFKSIVDTGRCEPYQKSNINLFNRNTSDLQYKKPDKYMAKVAIFKRLSRKGKGV